MNTRREFLKKSLYVTPIILTAAVRPTFARNTYGGGGSGGNPQTPGGRRHQSGGSSNFISKLVQEIKQI